MNIALKFVAASLLALQFAAINFQTAAAQTGEAAPADSLCDYCKDYTDAATSAGNTRSAYRPGAGYAAENEIAAARERQLEVAKLRAHPNSSKASTERGRRRCKIAADSDRVAVSGEALLRFSLLPTGGHFPTSGLYPAFRVFRLASLAERIIEGIPELFRQNSILDDVPHSHPRRHVSVIATRHRLNEHPDR
jgi:hypothetical protein